VIAVCIPTIGVGIRYLEFYIKNLVITASDPDSLAIYVSYHTDEDLQAIQNSSIWKRSLIPFWCLLIQRAGSLRR
jgi:hypothetical protein